MITETPKIIQIGVVPDISATSGAAIVAILAMMLQKPMELAVNSVGKVRELPRYTLVKREQLPNLTTNTSRGSVMRHALSHPQTAIANEPTAALVLEIMSAVFSPRYFTNNPEHALATNSLELLE